MKFVAAGQKLSLPRDLSVTADVALVKNPEGVGFAISVNLSVNLPGLTQKVIEKLVNDAHQVCPYSNATRGNIEITTTIK
jgi:osmotically inducible protein OsmC